jgi:alpha-beta hydrolase superfamily lysophospholipase
MKMRLTTAVGAGKSLKIPVPYGNKKRRYMKQDGFITAADGTRTAYSYWAAHGPGVILVHQLPSNRHSWDALAPDLHAKGYAVVAIDYRGRGESGGRLAAAKDFQDIALDMAAAKQFIRGQAGVDGRRLAIIGASIGANHALLAGVNDPGVKTAILLSPGLDYRSVKTADAARTFKRPILIAASDEDTYAAESSRELDRLAAEPKELIIYTGAGHGTDMLRGTDLQERLLRWLGRHL